MIEKLYYTADEIAQMVGVGRTTSYKMVNQMNAELLKQGLLHQKTSFEQRKEKAIWNKDNGRMYAHHVISFHKDEEITPEQAFEFGKVFAEKVFGSHQTLISVHQDKNHLHIHFVTNSVSFLDGYKFHISAKGLEQMKQITNDMCRERGLTVAEKGKHFDGTLIEAGTITSWSKDKYNMIKTATKESFLVGCMTAIKEAIETAYDKLEFIQKMKEKG